MFNRFIFKVAYRYFFARSSKTIVNRINRFAFIMIVVSACSLLVVLSAFSGLKDFGLLYTNSFDPDYKVIPEVGKHFILEASYRFGYGEVGNCWWIEGTRVDSGAHLKLSCLSKFSESWDSLLVQFPVPG